MLCPVCRYDNFEGEAQCANCGADLAAADSRPPLAEDDGTFLGERIDALPIGEPLIVDPGFPVADAIRKMHGSDSDCLLVCDEGRLIGIFTDRDASVKAVDKRLGLFKVRDFMTADPVVLREEDTVAVAINKMAVGGFRHLPIVVGDRPTGILTAADIFRHIVSLLG
jgi:CBS domain-containing protein